MDGKKGRAQILKKLGIEKLNAMQEEAFECIVSNPEVILLSPTGTGKTLAFLLPVISTLDAESPAIQALILTPSRELAIQIEQVVREMGSGYKVNAVYGGRSGLKDKVDLKHPPSILIGTPGRVADHLRRENIDPSAIKSIILDEFDKSLEIGFEEEMSEIIEALPNIQKKILTSATHKIEVPEFVALKAPKYIEFLEENNTLLNLHIVVSQTRDKRETLAQLLDHIGKGNGIVFCNFKDSIKEVSDFLRSKGIHHDCFYGGLDQRERERALIKFRNGTNRLLIATDLAARGLDIPELSFIIHYEISPKKDEFIHRNGRTARMKKSGNAYLLKWGAKDLPFEVDAEVIETLEPQGQFKRSNWATVFLSGGRKDKISKGDIAGLFFKQGGLGKSELGIIELKQDCAFVAVPHSKAKKLIAKLDNTRLKKKKVRIRLLD